MTRVVFVQKPDSLPQVPTGRVALVDVAFAFGPGFARETRPWLETVGERLALWVDHHDHEQWPRYRDDPRFVLVPRVQARACPQLVTPAVVADAGPVDTLLAHADLDGLLSAAQFLLGGRPPYPEAEEDARAVDDPMGGHRLSARGERLARGLAYLSGTGATSTTLQDRILQSLVAGAEPTDLKAELDRYAEVRAERERAMHALAEGAERPHPDVLLVRKPGLNSPDKKVLLNVLQGRALVGMVHDGQQTTAATPQGGLPLADILGLQCLPSYVWAPVPPENLLERLAPALDARRAQG